MVDIEYTAARKRAGFVYTGQESRGSFMRSVVVCGRSRGKSCFNARNSRCRWRQRQAVRAGRTLQHEPSLIAEGMILNFQERTRIARGELALETRLFDFAEGELAEEEGVLRGKRLRIQGCILRLIRRNA